VRKVHVGVLRGYAVRRIHTDPEITPASSYVRNLAEVCRSLHKKPRHLEPEQREGPADQRLYGGAVEGRNPIEPRPATNRSVRLSGSGSPGYD
jgi:hypothetical protein